MSLLFGGGGQKTKPQFTGLAAQTSTSAIGIPIGFGKNRSSPNIIWQADFKANKKKQRAGKGGPKQVTYTYSGSFIMALGWGPILDVTRVWKDQSKVTEYSELGMSLFLGSTPQSPWGYLTSSHPDEAIGYPGIAYLAVSNYDLGQSNSLPQHSFEVEWPLMGTQVGGNGDADPAQIIEAFLTNPSYGVGFDFTVFNQDTVFSGPDAPTTGDSAYQTYCRAMSFGLSPVISDQQAAGEILERWAKLTNTAIVWNGYEIKLRPYGSESVTGNGVTYLPDFSVAYSLNDKDFLKEEGSDPITFDRVDPADAKNGYSITISNRDNEYNDLPVSWRDQGLIDQYGYRKADPMDAKEICEPSMAAKVVSLIGQRVAYIRNKFMFKLGPQYQLIEPMDVLECVDPILGSFLVLVTSFEETDDDNYEVVAEEYHGSVTNPASVLVQSTTNTPVNTSVSPGSVNAPIVIEVPVSLTRAEATNPEIWVAVSGSDENWGGAFVWASTDDVTYDQIGNVDTAARMGVLTANLPDYNLANPDTVNTLRVSLDQSRGELEDATADDAAAFVTLSWVDGEFISYQNVDATGEFDYDITTLYRGLYGSTTNAHTTGDRFVRLDDSVFKYSVPPQFIGKTVYFKFQSYNQFGSGVEDLASCTAYPFTITGASFGTGASGAPVAPTGVSGVAGQSSAQIKWNQNVPNDGVSAYLIYRATGASQPFSSSTLIDRVSGNSTSYVDSSAVPGQPYTYFVVAQNAVGNGANSAGINVTPNAGFQMWSVTATGTGASQDITIPFAVTDEATVSVYVNGLRYETDQYSISGTTLTMTTNASGDSIEIVGIRT